MGGNLEKRVKRHVLGKTRSFFVSTLPGMERTCLRELASLEISTAGASVTGGGVAFAGRVHDCYRANLHLRTANRILMRIETFRATNFRQLAKRVGQVPWELYLPQDAPVEIHATSRQSRLFHTEAVADRFREGLANRRVGGGGHMR